MLRDAIRVLVAKATYDDIRYNTFLRVGGSDRYLYLDLGRQDWSLIAIGPDGWDITDEAPIKAVRRSNMQPLPVPECGPPLDIILRPLLNVRSERDYRQIVAWLLCAFSDTGENPILSISGEQGSAKSTTARMIRRLIDPDKATSHAAPQIKHDLVVAAHNARVISLESLSGLSLWLSDALYRISTGDGFSTRALHTNMDEVVEHLENPIILNGTPEIAGRPDLTDRSYTIHLPAITEQDRRTASDFWAEFENNHAFMLGALLDAVSSALGNLPNVRLPSKPRMANATEWVTAAEESLGWEAETHISDLQSNRRDANEASLECEPVAMAIVELDLPWTGTPTQLHKKLSDSVPGIPKTVNGFGAALMRIQPVLLQVGIAVEKKRGKERSITIKRIH